MLRITFIDGTTITLVAAESVRITGPNQITTNTFGNGHVVHRDVKVFLFEETFPLVTRKIKVDLDDLLPPWLQAIADNPDPRD